MDLHKTHSLETFAERHRADFDSHEPRPDLWAALGKQLDTANNPTAVPPMRAVNRTEAASTAVIAPARTGWLQRYGVAAALALLVFGAGASEAWKSNNEPALGEVANVERPGGGPAADVPDAALYQSGNLLALTAAEHTTGADSQLVRAVRGMETYYTNQLARRQDELRQSNGPGMASMAADWQRELVSLDSSYRKLKQELPRHPQPDAVLTAMNRNLQIRLDILDQQLHLRVAPAVDPNSGAYVLADSRHTSR